MGARTPISFSGAIAESADDCEACWAGAKADVAATISARVKERIMMLLLFCLLLKSVKKVCNVRSEGKRGKRQVLMCQKLFSSKDTGIYLPAVSCVSRLGFVPAHVVENDDAKRRNRI
jgi:hypothetical protein